MRDMAGRKRHSAEDIVRKLRRADELAAEGRTGEQITAEPENPRSARYARQPLLAEAGQRPQSLAVR